MKPSSSSSGTSSRSVVVTFKNNTEFELVRDSKKCLEGVWKNDPPPKINPKEEVVFRSEAKAGLSGTDAAVIYVLKGTKNTLTLEWSNPFVGNPKFVHKNPSSISVDVQKREGNNFLVDFVLNPPGQTSVREPSTQTELETALKQCNTQLQAVLKVKEGLVVMMRSYEKSADEKSAKILGPQIAEKEQEIESLTEKKERWERKLQQVLERKMIRRTIKPERESRIGLPALASLLARADFEYTKQEDSELSIKPGDIINLLDNSDEQWWYGEINGASGYFPATYASVLNTITSIDDDDASPRLKSARRSQEMINSHVSSSSETLIKSDSLPVVSEAVEHPPATRSVVCHAVALYEVTSLDEGTISFNVGRLIAVVDNDLNREQWTGILDGVIGTFPKSSVRVLTDEEYSSMKSEEIAAHEKQATGEHIAAPRHKRALVKFSYSAEGENELTINKGDFITLIDDAPNEEWWEGESNGKVGFFPKSYVVPLPDSSAWTNGVTSSHKKIGRVLFDYKAEGSNELALRVGQTVYVVDDDSEEEWWEGALDESLSTTGFFPRTYVQMISTAPSKSPRDRSKRISRDSNSSHHETPPRTIQPTISEHKVETTAKSDIVQRKTSDPAKRARPGPSNVGQSATLREKKDKQKTKAMSLRGLFGKKKERPTLVDFEEEFKELEREKEKEKEKDKKEKKKLKTSNSSDREKRKMKRSGSALETSTGSNGSSTAPTPRREPALLESTSAESSASDVLLDRLKQLETQNKRLEAQLKEYSTMLEKGTSAADSDQRVRELERQLKVENKRVQELEGKLKVASTPRDDSQVVELQQTVKRYEADLKEKDEKISYLTRRVAELDTQVHGSRKSVEVEPSSISKFELEIEALKQRVAELESTKPSIPKRPTRTPTNPPERPVVPPKVAVHQSPVADTHASGNSSEEVTPNSTPEVQASEETSKKRGAMTRQPSKAFLERKRFFEGRGSGTSTSQEKEDDKGGQQ